MPPPSATSNCITWGMQNRNSKIVFKDYNPNQMMLLPPSLEDMILKNHPVRVVNQVIDTIDVDPLLSKYKSGGCSGYHPRLLLKVLIFGYLTNTYSSRKLEESLHQDIHAGSRWLSCRNPGRYPRSTGGRCRLRIWTELWIPGKQRHWGVCLVQQLP